MTTNALSSSTVSALLGDPTLIPFLSETFSPSTYLNSTLPPLSTTATISSSSPTVSLQKLHSISTTLLSTLDVHLSRLQSTLSSLTDEILRATPRLSYEVEILRSDVISLAETLSSTRTRQLAEGLADVSLDESSQTTNRPTKDESNLEATTSIANVSSKPLVLQRLETLSLVRRHLEDVIKVFGEAMEWTLADNQKISTALPTTSTSSLGTYALTPSRSPSPAVMDGNSRKKSASQNATNSGSDKFTEEINFLLVNEEVDKATKKVEELAKLCEVWKNTSEYNTRLQFVEDLRWKVMEATEVGDANDATVGEGRDDDDRGVYTINLPEVSLPRDGYLGLINQFKQMRDSISQSG